MMFAVTEADFIAQPLRYARIYPSSRPIITTPKTKVVQFVLLNSAIIFLPFEVMKEEQINNYKDLYYDALQRSSANWDTNQNDYFPFIQNFLSMLYMCYKELDKRFAVVNGKKANKTARIEATLLDSLTAVSKSEICAIHPDISPTTVEAVLGRMVKEGRIRKIGAGKSTKYMKIP